MLRRIIATVLATLLLAAAGCATAALAALPPIALHPLNCKYCHAAQNDLDWAWNHTTYAREDAWLRCLECHTTKYIEGLGTRNITISGTSYLLGQLNPGERVAGVADAILNPNNVHFRVGCKCHAVLHMYWDPATGGWAAWIYYYYPNLTAANPLGGYPLINLGVPAYRPPPVYNVTLGPTGNWKLFISNVTYGNSTYLYKSGYWLTWDWEPAYLLCTSAGDAEVHLFTYQPGAVILENDTAGIWKRYLIKIRHLPWSIACSQVADLARQLYNPNVGGIAVRAVAVGFVDPLEKKFIPIRGFAGDWGVYDEFGVRDPARVCFNCHFLAADPAQVGVYRMVGGVLKIGIPPQTLKLPAHNITWSDVETAVQQMSIRRALSVGEKAAASLSAVVAAVMLVLKKLISGS